MHSQYPSREAGVSLDDVILRQRYKAALQEFLMPLNMYDSQADCRAPSMATLVKPCDYFVPMV